MLTIENRSFFTQQQYCSKRKPFERRKNILTIFIKTLLMVISNEQPIKNPHQIFINNDKLVRFRVKNTNHPYACLNNLIKYSKREQSKTKKTKKQNNRKKTQTPKHLDSMNFLFTSIKIIKNGWS